MNTKYRSGEIDKPKGKAKRLGELLWPCLFLASVCALARQNAVPAAQTPGMSDDRITLDVVVRDKAGKPVSGMQQQDFTILDNKQPQKILSFDAATSGSSPVEIVLVVDSVNTSFTNVAYERTQIQKFLGRDGGRLAQPLSLAFFSDAGLVVPTVSSRDGNALIVALNQNATGLRSIRRSQGFYGASDRSQLSLDAIRELAEFAKSKPGRKIVIWVSPGWPMLSGANVQLTAREQQRIFDSIVAISTELRQSGITLYSVDPLGTSDSVGYQTSNYKQFLKGVRSPSQVYFGDLALQVLAYQSGGLVLNSNNDISSEIESCIREANAYYVLSFGASPADGPDEYHALQVKIDHPGLKAQTRSGYYAQPSQSQTR
jgi:VWFA-related protein